MMPTRATMALMKICTKFCVLASGFRAASVSAPANSRCNDVYGDGRTIVLVTLSPAPRCLQAVPISCGGGLTEDRQDSFGVAGAPASVVSGSCYEALWEVTAVATEIKSGAQAVVTQGVKLQTSGAACI